MQLSLINTKIAAVCPIIGLSADKNGVVSIQFDPTATPQQQTAALAAVATYTADGPTAIADKQAEMQWLIGSDIDILRHIEEVALGQVPYLSPAQYTALLQQRQATRAILST